MTAYERGDVVLVPFPFSDQTTTKKRPAVIISSNTYNNVSSDWANFLLRILSYCKITKRVFRFKIK
jgi:mRNA-degrading endonuclease toxin of MazEF toxin-antitoxin module